MLHPDTELRYINQSLGFGIVATCLIPRGTIVWVLDKRAYQLPNGNSVLNWDLARYFNHSCDPSCMNAGMAFEIAVRDIPPGAELTVDYRMLNKSLPYECACD